MTLRHIIPRIIKWFSPYSGFYILLSSICVGVIVGIIVSIFVSFESTSIGILSGMVAALGCSGILLLYRLFTAESQLFQAIGYQYRKESNLEGLLSNNSLLSALRDRLVQSPLLDEPIVSRLVLDRINSLQGSLEGLQNGSLKISIGNFMEFQSEMVAAAKESIIANTYIKPEVWWKTEEVENYFIENVKAIKRGVTISRVFMFDNEKELKKAKDVLWNQKNARIEVRILMLKDVPPDEQRDFAIIDNKVAFENGVTPDRTHKTEFCVYTIKHDDFKYLKNLASRLLERSSLYKG